MPFEQRQRLEALKQERRLLEAKQEEIKQYLSVFRAQKKREVLRTGVLVFLLALCIFCVASILINIASSILGFACILAVGWFFRKSIGMPQKSAQWFFPRVSQLPGATEKERANLASLEAKLARTKAAITTLESPVVAKTI